MPLELSLKCANEELEGLSVFERIRWAKEKTPNLLLSTSGGEKFSLLPHITRSVLGEEMCPLLFVDTGYYPPQTLEAINWLKSNGYDVRTYSSPHPLEDDGSFFGLDFKNPHSPYFGEWVKRRKHEPTQRALNQLRPDVWMGGRMRDQQASRSEIPIIERKGDVFQFNPLADWTKADVSRYMQVHALPTNPNHDELMKDLNGECKMWYIEGDGI